MNRKLLAAAAATLLGIASPSWAGSITIDFDGFPFASPWGGGAEDGFQLTPVNGQIALGEQSGTTITKGFTNVPQADTSLTITEENQTPFSFLDLRAIKNGGSDGGDAEMTLEGFLNNVLVGSFTFKSSNNNDFQTVGPDSLNNKAIDRLVVRLPYVAGTGGGYYFILDNIRLDPDVAAVPEPGTLALALAGLAGLGLSRRRRAG